MKNIEIIALDLDGTLLNSKKEITKETRDCLQNMSKKGLKIVIVTGRSYLSAKAKVEQLGIKVDIICFNGAKVVNSKGEIEFEQPVEPAVIKRLIKKSREKGIHLNLYQDEKWFVENSDSEETKYYKEISELTPIEKNFDTFKNLKMTKALYIGDKALLKSLEKEIKLEFKNEVYTAYSQTNFFEVLNSEVNKGLTLEKYLKNKGISMENCVAFGDAENDKEMLEKVGYGVAMGNADEKIKKIAKYVTKNNENNGIKYFFDQIL